MDDYKTSVDAVRARINALLKEKRITQNQVAAGDTSAQKRINGQLSHGTNLSLDTVLRVLDACPDISAEWLLQGTGSRLRPGNQQVGEPVHGYDAAPAEHSGTLTEDFVQKLMAEKDRQIGMLIEKLGK